MQNQKEERHPWKLEEDNLITELVRQYGTKKWTLIADVLKEKVPNSHRNGKQCRERWHNHLDPMVRKSPWNETEEFVFIEAHKIHGNKWSEIAKMVPGRTDNAIKNHFYSTLRKLISRVQKEDVISEIRFDQQQKRHTLYLIKYLKNLILHQTQNDQQENEQLRQILGGADMGTNDLYVTKKLKECGVTYERITQYARKIKQACREANQNLKTPILKSDIDTQKVTRPIFFVCKEESKKSINSNKDEDQNMRDINQLKYQNDVDSDEEEQQEMDQEKGLQELKEKSQLLLKEYNESKFKELQQKEQQEQAFEQIKKNEQIQQTSFPLGIQQQNIIKIPSINFGQTFQIQNNQNPKINYLIEDQKQFRCNSAPRLQPHNLQQFQKFTPAQYPNIQPFNLYQLQQQHQVQRTSSPMPYIIQNPIQPGVQQQYIYFQQQQQQPQQLLINPIMNQNMRVNPSYDQYQQQMYLPYQQLQTYQMPFSQPMQYQQQNSQILPEQAQVNNLVNTLNQIGSAPRPHFQSSENVNNDFKKEIIPESNKLKSFNTLPRTPGAQSSSIFFSTQDNLAAQTQITTRSPKSSLCSDLVSAIDDKMSNDYQNELSQGGLSSLCSSLVNDTSSAKSSNFSMRSNSFNSHSKRRVPTQFPRSKSKFYQAQKNQGHNDDTEDEEEDDEEDDSDSQDLLDASDEEYLPQRTRAIEMGQYHRFLGRDDLDDQNQNMSQNYQQ